MQWNPINTIPLGMKVKVKTQKGLERCAIGRYLDKNGNARCTVSEKGKHGDVTAIAWLPL